MISKEQLESAVSAGILDQSTADALLAHVNADTPLKNIVDEEQFRLVSGFNDIFVVIASILLFTSLAWLGGNVFGSLMIAATAWGLSEFFVLKRRMALPAIVLLLYFVGGIFISSLNIISDHSLSSSSVESYEIIAPCLIAIASAWAHWKRFKVPITMAAGAIFVVGVVIAASASMIENKSILLGLTSLSGLGVFALAMRWDASDTHRQTRRSDVAFWLHLIAAPLIIHPVFELLGVLNNQTSLFEASIVLILYLMIGAISLIIDRRALMVSALGYVIYVFSTLLSDAHSGIGFAVTALTIGSALLLLSAFWHKCRGWLLKIIPNNIKQFLAN